MFTVIRRVAMSAGSVILNEIKAPRIADKALPGQFVILKSRTDGERIPLTIADSDREKGTITVVYIVVGNTTTQFSQLQEGDSFCDVIGPLGKPTHIEKRGKIVCVGGGSAVAVLHPITRAMKEVGNHVICIIGAKTKDLLILEDEMRAASNDLRICTDDGSLGHHGFVTDVLKNILDEGDVKQVIAIGPVPMMRAISNLTRGYQVPTLVSLNPIMVDGTGMCGGCRVTVGGEMKFACVDGPEFDGHLVDFDELQLRQQAYREQEQESRELNCKLMKNA